MPYRIVDASEAPMPPKKVPVSKSVKYFRELIENLEPGKVAIVTPDESQSQRGIKISVGRIATGMGKKVTSWSLDGDENVYVTLAE